MFGARFGKASLSSMFRPKSYRQNDRTERDTKSWYSSKVTLTLYFTVRLQVFAKHMFCRVDCLLLARVAWWMARAVCRMLARVTWWVTRAVRRMLARMVC